MVVFEAPLDPRFMGGKTNINTAMVLLGLPAIVEGACFLMGVYRVKRANAASVRKHILGFRPGKGEAKAALEKMVAEGTKLQEASVKLAESAFAPVNARMTVAMEKMAKPLAA